MTTENILYQTVKLFKGRIKVVVGVNVDCFNTFLLYEVCCDEFVVVMS